MVLFILGVDGPPVADIPQYISDPLSDKLAGLGHYACSVRKSPTLQTCLRVQVDSADLLVFSLISCCFWEYGIGK